MFKNLPYLGNLIDFGFGYGIICLKRWWFNSCNGSKFLASLVTEQNFWPHTQSFPASSMVGSKDQRLIVYKYMSLGSLEDHLYGIFCSRAFSSYPLFVYLNFEVSLEIFNGGRRFLSSGLVLSDFSNQTTPRTWSGFHHSLM